MPSHSNGKLPEDVENVFSMEDDVNSNKCLEVYIANIEDEKDKEKLLYYRNKFLTSLESYDNQWDSSEEFCTSFGNKHMNKLQYVLIKYAEAKKDKDFKKASVIQCVHYYNLLCRNLNRNVESIFYGSSFLSNKQFKQFGINSNLKKTFDDALIATGYLNKIRIEGEGCQYFPLFVRNENTDFLPNLEYEKVRSYFFGDKKF